MRNESMLLEGLSWFIAGGFGLLAIGASLDESVYAQKSLSSLVAISATAAIFALGFRAIRSDTTENQLEWARV